MCATALIQSKRLQHLLFRSIWHFRAVKVDALLRRITLSALELLLKEAPLIGQDLAAFETTHWDNHLGAGGCYLSRGKSCGHNFR